MPRTKNVESRSKLCLNLPIQVRDRLERIRQKTEADSITEVIRRASELYDTLLTVSKRGRIVIKNKDGTECELLLVLPTN